MRLFPCKCTSDGSWIHLNRSGSLNLLLQLILFCFHQSGLLTCPTELSEESKSEDSKTFIKYR